MSSKPAAPADAAHPAELFILALFAAIVAAAVAERFGYFVW